MIGRSRHGLHVVRDGEAPIAEPMPPGPVERRSVSLHLSSVALAVAGRLDANTAARLRMFLSVFTVDGGPMELVLDLSDVSDVDADGMAPIFEAADVLSLRTASLRLTSLSLAVAHFLDGARHDRTLVTDRPGRDCDDPGRGRD